MAQYVSRIRPLLISIRLKMLPDDRRIDCYGQCESLALGEEDTDLSTRRTAAFAICRSLISLLYSLTAGSPVQIPSVNQGSTLENRLSFIESINLAEQGEFETLYVKYMDFR